MFTENYWTANHLKLDFETVEKWQDIFFWADDPNVEVMELD